MKTRQDAIRALCELGDRMSDPAPFSAEEAARAEQARRMLAPPTAWCDRCDRYGILAVAVDGIRFCADCAREDC